MPRGRRDVALTIGTTAAGSMALEHAVARLQRTRRQPSPRTCQRDAARSSARGVRGRSGIQSGTCRRASTRFIFPVRPRDLQVVAPLGRRDPDYDRLGWRPVWRPGQRFGYGLHGRRARKNRLARHVSQWASPRGADDPTLGMVLPMCFPVCDYDGARYANANWVSYIPSASSAEVKLRKTYPAVVVPTPPRRCRRRSRVPRCTRASPTSAPSPCRGTGLGAGSPRPAAPGRRWRA